MVFGPIARFPCVSGRLTIGLYNCYDPVRFHDIMRRTLARAAPVALAYDCNLATFGFPFDEGRRRESKNPDAPDLRTPTDVAEFVVGSTSISSADAPLLQLAEGGRFNAFDFPGKGFPPQLGRPIATSEHPQPKARPVTPRDVAKELHVGRSQLVVLGLGPRGLPKDVLKSTPHCLELTGRNIGFETATVLGALPAAIATHLEWIGGSR